MGSGGTKPVSRAGCAATAFCLLAAGLATGCARPERPPVREAFAKLTERALAGDSDYVRAHVAPALLEAPTSAPEATDEADVVEQIRGEIQFSRFERVIGSEAGNRATVEAASVQTGVFGGSVWLFRIDLAYDEAKGWRLISHPYDQHPITTQPSS